MKQIHHLLESKHFSSLALWPFEALNSNMSTQSVSRGFPRCLRVRYFVVYGVSKLRRFKNRNEDTETKIIFLLTLDISRRRHREPEHFNSNKNKCTVILSVSLPVSFLSRLEEI